MNFFNGRTLTVWLITMLLGGFALAQSRLVGVPSIHRSSPSSSNVLTNRVLQNTHFETAAFGGVTASCNAANCLKTVNLFSFSSLGVRCPALANHGCTFYIHVESQNMISASDDGFYQFLVDGKAPIPGPTDAPGFYAWLIADPDSGPIVEGRSSAVTAQVVNTVANQNHKVQVKIGCFDINGNGCTATGGFASLRIDVFTP
jgi:hypothetical protein